MAPPGFVTIGHCDHEDADRTEDVPRARAPHHVATAPCTNAFGVVQVWSLVVTWGNDRRTCLDRRVSADLVPRDHLLRSHRGECTTTRPRRARRARAPRYRGRATSRAASPCARSRPPRSSCG